MNSGWPGRDVDARSSQGKIDEILAEEPRHVLPPDVEKQIKGDRGQGSGCPDRVGRRFAICKSRFKRLF